MRPRSERGEAMGFSAPRAHGRVPAPAVCARRGACRRCRCRRAGARRRPRRAAPAPPSAASSPASAPPASATHRRARIGAAAAASPLPLPRQRRWLAAPRPAPTPRSRKSELVQISDPYIELRTGPGRGYPIFFVAPRSEWIEIELRHTDWFRIRTEDDKVGWVSRQQLESTLTAAGSTKSFRDVLLDDYLSSQGSARRGLGTVQVRADVEAMDQLSPLRHVEPRGHARPGAGRLLGHRPLAHRRADRAVVGPSPLALLRRRRRQVQELPEPRA